MTSSWIRCHSWWILIRYEAPPYTRLVIAIRRPRKTQGVVGQFFVHSGREELNLRPPAPEARQEHCGNVILVMNQASDAEFAGQLLLGTGSIALDVRVKPSRNPMVLPVTSRTLCVVDTAQASALGAESH